MRTGLIAALAAAGLALTHDAHADEPKQEVDAGWSMGAGFISIPADVLLTGSLGLALFATAGGPSKSSADVTIGSLAVGSGIVAVAGPLMELGVHSARGVRGAPVARIVGWISYGALMGITTASLVGAAVACGTGNYMVGGDPWCGADGLGAAHAIALPLLGFTSLTAFAVDAFVAAGQAHRATPHPTARGVSVLPIVTPVVGGASLGLGGSF